MLRSILSLLLLSALFGCAGPAPRRLTPAEADGFATTSRYAEIMEFLQALARDDDRLTLETFGRTPEGRDLPLCILSAHGAEPAPMTEDRGITVFINANIHAGEVAGKEACLLLIRDLLADPKEPLLEKMVILIAPIYNADGNERIDPTNRAWQPGPEEGVGMRTNAQSLDLNRDMMKLESLEAQGLVRNILTRWDPDLVVDCHTTNGSYHQEPITYAASQTALIDPGLLRYNRDEMLPCICALCQADHGYASIPYGNFKDPMDPGKGWETFDHRPRYLSNYVGLRNRLSILIELYVYSAYEVRIRACHAFLQSILTFASADGQAMRQAVMDADRATVEGRDLRLYSDYRAKAFEKPITIQGYLMERASMEGRMRPRPVLDERRTWKVPYFGLFEPLGEGTLLPCAYLFPRGQVETRDLLARHGIRVDEVKGPFEAKVQSFQIEKIAFDENLFQGHRLQRLQGQWKEEEMRFPQGVFVVSADQPLFRVAAYLLEPESDDGMACWNQLDRYLTRGNWDPRPGAYPIVKKRD